MINKLTMTEKMRIFSFSILFIFIATILLQPAAVLGAQPGETVTDATVPAGPQEKPSPQAKSVSVAKQHPSAHSQLSPGSDVLVAPYILKR